MRANTERLCGFLMLLAMLLCLYAGFTGSRFLFLAAIPIVSFLAEDLGEWTPPYHAVAR